jgi:two-component system NtrC family sensor kinase
MAHHHQGGNTWRSTKATAILGYPVSDWLKADFLPAHIHPDDQSSILKLQKIDTGEKAEVEFRIVAAAGHWVPVRNIISFAESANARRVLRGIMLDVTERKKLESDLAQSQKLESVGRLAAGIAHEINTPVQFVSDSIHFVRDGTHDLSALIEKYQQLHRASATQVSAELTAEITRTEENLDLPYLLDRMPKALDRALSGLSHVAVIVRSMKEFAHPDQLDKTGVDLNQAIASTLTIANNECKYVADVQTDLGELPAVTCYAGDINQVVLNVVVNAAHAIADQVQGTDRRGRIGVRTWCDGEQVVIAISDTGAGIPEPIRSKIFDPFFTTKSVGRGTGQGLAIARSVVVDKHGGTIDFETEVGRGTTFFIRLPIDGVPVTVEVA